MLKQRQTYKNKSENITIHESMTTKNFLHQYIYPDDELYRYAILTVLYPAYTIQPVVKPGCTAGLTTDLTTGCIV